MRLIRSALPSFQRGYARNPGESLYPGLWEGLTGLKAPILGNTGLVSLPDWLPDGTDGAINGTPGWEHDNEPGHTLDFVASDSDFIDVGATTFLPGTEYSICIYTSWDAGLILYAERSTSSAFPIRGQLYNPGGGNLGFITRDNASGNQTLARDSINHLGTGYHLFCGVRDGADLFVFTDGVQGDTANGAAGTITIDTSYIYAQTNVGTPAGFSTGRVGLVLTYSRVITPGEQSILAAKPHALFMRKPSTAFFAPAAAFALPVISPNDIHSSLFGGQVINGG